MGRRLFVTGESHAVNPVDYKLVFGGSGRTCRKLSDLPRQRLLNIWFYFLVIADNSSGAAVSVPSVGGASLKTKSSHHQLQKAASVGSRSKKLYSSVSTDETLESSSPLLGVVGIVPGGGTTADSSRIVKQHSKRWSTFLGIKNPHQNQLCELLNQYARNGVPQFQQSFTFNHHNLLAALDYLSHSHSSWTTFVNCSGMTDAETKIQSAIWELVTTEIYYIHALQTVTDVSVAPLKCLILYCVGRLTHSLTWPPQPSTVVPGVLEGGPGGEPADGRGPEQTLFEHRRVVRDEFNVLDALPVPDGAAQHHHRPSDVY